MDTVAKNLTVRRLQGFKEILKSQSVQDILHTMKNDRVFNDAELSAITTAQDVVEETFIHLEKAKKEGKITLLDFRWQLLPWVEVELILVTDVGMHRYVHKEP
jgi:hypothetical protein